MKYTICDNIKFIARGILKWDRELFWFLLGAIICNMIAPILTMILPSIMVELLYQDTNIGKIVLFIILLAGAIFIARAISGVSEAKISWHSSYIRFQYVNLCNLKMMDADYEKIESSEGQIKHQKALNAVFSQGGGLEQILKGSIILSTAAIGTVVIGVTFTKEFLSVLIVTLIVAVVQFILLQKHENDVHSNKENWIPLQRKMNYITNQAISFQWAKDIHAYKMTQWFTQLFQQYLSERMIWKKKEERREFYVKTFIFAMVLLRDLFSYIFIIRRVLAGQVDLAQFVYFFSALNQLSNWITQFFDGLLLLKRSNLEVNDLREFLEMSDSTIKNGGISVRGLHISEIEFKNVSYIYPSASAPVIESLNLRIQAGEKIALVGKNGAGKTTLVKLLCGLYRPTLGEILVNGLSVNQYNRDEYFSLFSVVFQDIYLMPSSIQRNVTFTDKYEKEKWLRALEQSGLDKIVQKLPEKEGTKMMKGVLDGGIDLSGGERQTLAIARALYKDGDLLILDEPTAALDPLAESSIYQKYHALTKNKTAIFISHRLASTQFCDKIYVLDKGKIIEQGTHEELLEKNGSYAEMFRAQSHYYQSKGR